MQTYCVTVCGASVHCQHKVSQHFKGVVDHALEVWQYFVLAMYPRDVN